jgi:hypothetical protein
MSNVKLVAREDEFEYSDSGKDIGVIEKVSKRAYADITNATVQKVYLHSQQQPIFLYDVKLVTRNLYLYDVPAFFSKNDISVLEIGDTVMVDYMSSPPCREPFIVNTVNLYPGQAAVSFQTSVPVNEGERLIQTSKGNSIHLRQDGAVCITGGYVLENNEEGHYYSDNPFHLVLGGRQGMMKETGNPVRFTVMDKLGVIFQSDNAGALVTRRVKTFQSSNDSYETISETKNVSVGVDSELDAYRTGDYNLEVQRDGDEYFGQGLDIKVGDSSKGDKRQFAPLTITVAKAITIESKNGEITVKNNGRSITLTEAGEIKIGDPTSSTEPLVLGFKMLNWLAGLYSWATAVGSAVGVPPAALGVNLPLTTDLLSQKNTTD